MKSRRTAMYAGVLAAGILSAVCMPKSWYLNPAPGSGALSAGTSPTPVQIDPDSSAPKTTALAASADHAVLRASHRAKRRNPQAHLVQVSEPFQSPGNAAAGN